MSRIESSLMKLKQEGRKALAAFVTAGDPDLNTTARLVKEMERQGADIIELGVPFSDPVAEGPVIQRANARALSKGIKIKDLMTKVSEMRKEVSVPIVYLLYFNCILKYGIERFFKECMESGVDGVIIPDLPYEERDEIDDIAERFSVDVITLVAPTSKERIQKIAANAKGFLYCVSSLGVTGVRKDFSTDFNDFFSYINQATDIPKLLGFGISTPEHVQSLKRYCDGVIVGSAVVRCVEESSDGDEAVKKVGEYVKTLRQSLDD